LFQNKKKTYDVCGSRMCSNNLNLSNNVILYLYTDNGFHFNLTEYWKEWKLINNIPYRSRKELNHKSTCNLIIWYLDMDIEPWQIQVLVILERLQLLANGIGLWNSKIYNRNGEYEQWDIVI